ncbi:MAG: homoserine dehydrogenase [Chloroflexi bacterium]|nr:homoserine dehydrogenase [Chloroflexota bacterium]
MGASDVSTARPLGVGLLGLGVVGSAVAAGLMAGRGELAGEGARPLVLRKALVRDLRRKRTVDLDPGVLTTDPAAVLDDPSVDVVVEVMGGEQPAFDYISRAIRGGKHVVTANKEVLCKRGDELFTLAAEHGVRLLHEASVGGGIPIVGPLSSDLLANRIESIRAIINGTTNYILTKMAAQGAGFDQVLEEAKKLGYAEADPTSDVDGWDAAYKIAVLARVAFGVSVPLDAVHREGIRGLEAQEFRYAATLGYTIKLLAVARREQGGLLVRVHPALIPSSVPMAKVDGVLNVVEVEGDLVGPLWLQGRGAGPDATASAVLGDLLRIARGAEIRKNVAAARSADRLKLVSIDDHECKYYFRLVCKDRPGVLAQIAGILGKLQISIASVIQMDANAERGEADLVIMTHPSLERNVQKAVREIAALQVVARVASVLRVEAY